MSKSDVDTARAKAARAVANKYKDVWDVVGDIFSDANLDPRTQQAVTYTIYSEMKNTKISDYASTQERLDKFDEYCDADNVSGRARYELFVDLAAKYLVENREYVKYILRDKLAVSASRFKGTNKLELTKLIANEMRDGDNAQ